MVSTGDQKISLKRPNGAKTFPYDAIVIDNTGIVAKWTGKLKKYRYFSIHSRETSCDPVAKRPLDIPEFRGNMEYLV